MLMHALGKRVMGCGDDESRVLGAYGRDVLNDNGKRLLSFATDKLALTSTFSAHARKGGISHTWYAQQHQPE